MSLSLIKKYIEKIKSLKIKKSNSINLRKVEKVGKVHSYAKE